MGLGYYCPGGRRMRNCCPPSCCPGGAKGGAGAGILLLAAVGAEIALHAALFLVAATAVLIACGYLSAAAVMVFYAYLTRDQAKAGAQLEARRAAPALAARTVPQVTQGTTLPTIENHVHYHVHFGAEGLEPARVRTVIPGRAGDHISGRES